MHLVHDCVMKSLRQVAHLGRGQNSKSPMLLSGFIERTWHYFMCPQSLPMNPSGSNYHTPTRPRPVAKDRRSRQNEREHLVPHSLREHGDTNRTPKAPVKVEAEYKEVA